MAFFWLPLPVWHPPAVQQFGGILIRFEASMLSNAIWAQGKGWEPPLLGPPYSLTRTCV